MTGKSPKWAERTAIEPNVQGSIRSDSKGKCLEDIVHWEGKHNDRQGIQQT